MKHLTFILLACLLSACTSAVHSPEAGSDDWTIFRSDQGLSGYTDTRLPEKPVLKWAYQGETRTVSSPVVADGTTYWSDKRGRIQGVDINGELVFEYNLQTAVEATPLISDSVLYIGRIDGFMTAISLTGKDTLWHYETMGQLSASPNLLEFRGRKAVVFGSYDNYLYCLDARNGEELSKFESGYYLNGAAAVWKEHVIFGGCDAWLRIVDCQTGTPTDSVELEAYIPASPAIKDNDCYVGDHSGNIYHLTLEDGKILRQEKIVAEDDENSSFVAVPAVSNDRVYVFSGDRNLRAISRTNNQVQWEYLLKGNVGESAPVVCRDKVIVCTKTGIVSILDAKTGKLLWEYDAGEQIVGSPAVIKDHFMILTAKGTLLCFN